jgi:hypothetical protein
VQPKKISLKLGSYTKLATRFCGPFEILDRIWQVAYMLALPTSMNVYTIFHVYFMKTYLHDLNHVIDWNFIQVEPKGDIQVQMVCILDKKDKVL